MKIKIPTVMRMTNCAKVLLFLLIPFASVAQVHDAGTWLGLNTKLRLKKRIDLAVSFQVRTASFSSEMDQAFLEPELRYRMKNGLRWALAYRPCLKFDLESGAYLRHRYHLQVQYSRKFGEFTVGTRVRFQQRFVPIRGAERLPSSDQPMALRNKWSISYRDFKKLEPFIQFEYFVGLSGQVPVRVNTLRYKGGVEFDLPKKFFLSVFYMAEQELAETQPTFYHVLGISVARDFDLRIKD